MKNYYLSSIYHNSLVFVNLNSRSKDYKFFYFILIKNYCLAYIYNKILLLISENWDFIIYFWKLVDYLFID